MIFSVKFDRVLKDGAQSIISFIVPTYQLTEIDKTKEFKLELTELKSKRSVFQNRKMWALIHEIAYHEGLTDNDVYCQIIEMANLRVEYLQVLPEAIDSLKKVFRVVKEVEERTSDKGKLMKVIQCYYGTSTFDTKEMSEFIDRLLDYASQIGIDVREYRE